jgi:signal transduction histidine kinase
MPEFTHFAPAERSPSEEVQRQARLFPGAGPLRTLIDSAPGLLVVLNRERQIVFASRAFVEAFGAGEPADVIGLRPGEALRCNHAWANAGGCGTSEFCRDCGAARAILAAQSGMRNAQECRVMRRIDGREEWLEVLVSTAPIEVDGEPFVACHLADIGHEKRRRALERVFFHDVLNTASSIHGIVQMLDLAEPAKRSAWLELLRASADQVIAEIQAQQQLLAAEVGELAVSRQPLRSRAFLVTIAGMYRNNPVAEGRSIAISEAAADARIVTDSCLITRVMGNLVKNALEACEPGDAVTLDCAVAGGVVELRVHNPGAMPETARRQVFTRSFSTKGVGRGLGTYSVKLLTEQYLGGTVAFRSSLEGGTTFLVRLPIGE